MTIPPHLSEIISQHFDAFPVWPPVAGNFSPGDYGIYADGKFNRVGNIRNFKKDFKSESRSVGGISYLSPGATLTKFVGDSKVDVIPSRSKDARIEIQFSKPQSLFFHAPVVTKSSIPDLNKFDKLINSITEKNIDWKFIVELYEAESVILVTSDAANTIVNFTGAATLLREMKLSDPGITINKGDGVQYHAGPANGIIAFGFAEFRTSMFGSPKHGAGKDDFPAANPESKTISANILEIKPPYKNVIEDIPKDVPSESVGYEIPVPTGGVEVPMSPQPAGATMPEENAASGLVQLGASAPGRVRPKQEFTARFVAYVKELETEMKQKLKDLSPSGTHHLGIKECTWQKGTKVKVRLSGSDLAVDPPEDEFTWNGTSQIVDFDVVVADLKEPAQTVLKFDVSIDNIIVARLRIDLEINDKAGEEKRQEVKANPIRTAFASYASQDRLRVLDRVSEIVRNGVDVFMDCMSMQPGEKWEPRLEKEIRERDSFLLFWSANAVKSKWVNLEWKTALKERGIDRIEPHPLEPPNLAPPPEELKALHFNDIYIIARKANEG